MFDLIKRLFSRRAERKRKLVPESRYVLTVTATEIVNQLSDGKTERVELADLKAVIIETNDSGPGRADVWWVLAGSSPEKGIVFPGGATGESDVLAAVQKLPGFDDEVFIEAMGSTSNRKFVCWKAVQG